MALKVFDVGGLSNRDAVAVKLQFAVRGEWENALALAPGDDSSSLRRWAAGRGDGEMAFEVFASMSFEEDFFWGVRFERMTDEHYAVVERLIEDLGAGLTVEGSIKMAEELAGARLFAGEPDFCELSMVNMWRPFGPLRFWSRGDARSPASALEEALAGDAKYGHPHHLPLAVESAFASPLPHWTGRVVSRRRGDGLWVTTRT